MHLLFEEKQMKSSKSFVFMSIVITIMGFSSSQAQDATLIFHNAKVWTVDESQPLAQAVAIRGSRIIKVGGNVETLALRGAATKVIDLKGKMLLPGFIDAHTHFENAVGYFFEVRLMDVNDQDEFLKRLRETVQRVPKGIWITGCDWGAFAAWDAEKKGNWSFVPLKPDLAAVDALTHDHPVLFRRYDHVYFANSKALQLARIGKHTPNPRGGRYEKSPSTGELTGILIGTAGERMEKLVPPVSHEQKLMGARRVQEELNRFGITSIHDIARVDEISQRKLFHTHVERSHSDLSIFLDLRKRGELTVRVYPILTLRVWRELLEYGIQPGQGDEMIQYGGLKAFVDGTLMFESYANSPNYAGNFTWRVVDEQTMENDIVGADSAGFDSAIHVIGDKAHYLLLNWYEAAIAKNKSRDRRFRLIHVQYPSLKDIQRAGRMRAIADMTPYHMLRDVVATERLLGPERAKTAHAWRTMIQNGVRINIVSDWPGSFDKSSISPVNPLENMFYAIARQDTSGIPPGGWHASEAITIQEAIQAYTINPAFASHEEHLKGSITEGKLADLVVLSKDIISIQPRELLSTEVLYTIFDGRIVYQKQ